MGDVAVARPVLSDSNYKTRPTFQTILMTDANAGGNSVQQIQERWRSRQMKFPVLSGKKDVDSFKNVRNVTAQAFKKYNDEGHYRVPAPYRSCDNILDPVSGFVSVCGDVDRNTGHTKIPSMVTLSHAPQHSAPQLINSVRVQEKAAPQETRRMTERDPGSPYPWNSRKVLDAVIRAQLGGWTSDSDPRIHQQEKLRGQIASTPRDEASHLRDKLAHRYMYTSSTQRSYEHIPWDNMLAPKQWPPTTTLELRPDMISQRFSPHLKRYEQTSQPWQDVGETWDRMQTRQGHYKDGPMDIVLGSIGAVNLDEKDNRKEPFQPLTIKRNPIPWPSDTSHRPQIPGYKGCTLYRSQTAPAMGQHQSCNTSASVYGERPMDQSQPEFKRKSWMSKMVTTVPPFNPFNKQKKDGTVDTV